MGLVKLYSKISKEHDTPPTWRCIIIIEFFTRACHCISQCLGSQLSCPVIWWCRWLWRWWRAWITTDIKQQISWTWDHFFWKHLLNSCVIVEIPMWVCWVLTECCVMTTRHCSHVITYSIQVIAILLSTRQRIVSTFSPACQWWQSVVIGCLLVRAWLKVSCHVQVRYWEVDKCIKLCSTSWSLKRKLP